MPQPKESTPSPYQFGEETGGVTPPTGAPAGRFLRDDGTWATLTGSGGTASLFTSSADGIVPASGGGAVNFLRADGTWVTPTDTTYSAFSGGVTGLVPSSSNNTTDFLRSDGTFAAPSDDAKADKASSNTFGGTQEFTNAPTCSTAAASNTELVNKLYVDTSVTTLISGVVLNAFAVTVTANHAFTGGATFSSTAPTTSVTPSSANDITNKSYVDSVAAAPKTFLAIGTSTASLANSTIDITWDTPEISDSDIAVSSNELTFSVAGTYAIDLSARVSGNERVESTLQTFKDTGSGYSELTNHTASNYNLRDTDQNTGSTVLSTMLTLAAGDKLKFQITGDTDGTAVLMTAGTILRIVGYA